MKLISFCFDDGFHATADKVRAIFSEYRVKPCFCILARPDLAKDPYISGAAIADWSYWREAQAAGCEVSMHGYAHENLHQQSFDDATENLKRCIDNFTHELQDIVLEEHVFHLAYMTAPDPVIAWLRQRFAGVRIGLDKDGISDPRSIMETKHIDCVCYGHADTDRLLLNRIEKFVKLDDGILTVVLHGLDGEGWGPIRSETLRKCLETLQQANGVSVLTPNRIIQNLREV